MANSLEIIPTILASSPESYQKSVSTYQSFAKRVQIDISDGQFAPGMTVSEANLTWPESWAVDFHMMVVRPSEHVQNLLKLKPNLVIFHAETGEDLLPIFDQLRAAGIKCGVALAKQTFPARAKTFIEAADHVLIFAGELGRQGGEADMLQTEKIPLVTAIKPDVEIGWDGGANMQNVRALARAGVNVINVGAALATAEKPAETLEAMVQEADKHGVLL